MTDVLIVGAGPAGLLLACELRLAGVDTLVIERHPTRPGFCRGFNLNARALDLLDRRGLAEPLVAEGWRAPQAAFSGLPVTLSLDGARTAHPYSLGIPQTRVEEVLEERALALGAEIRRGHELCALRQDEAGVEATVAGEHGRYTIRIPYLVGCDGGRSTVRRQAGIDFPGTAATRWTLLGDVELAEPGALGYGRTEGPGGAVLAIPRPGYVRVITADPDPPADRDEPVTLDRLEAAVAAALGRPVGLTRPRWLTRFGDAARQAADYVRGRVVLAGDAAHIHPPAGAIGVNVALDDAFNLGWKLAATVRGTAPAHLLGTYHTERHAAGADVLRSTRAQVLLGQAGPDLAPLVDLFTRVARHPDGNRALAEVVTGLATSYTMPGGGEHPWVGRLVPAAPRQPEGRGLLLDPAGATLPWRDRVDVVAAGGGDTVLVRPDGHVAWAGAGRDGLEAALGYWFGRP